MTTRMARITWLVCKGKTPPAQGELAAWAGGTPRWRDPANYYLYYEWNHYLEHVDDNGDDYTDNSSSSPCKCWSGYSYNYNDNMSIIIMLDIIIRMLKGVISISGKSWLITFMIMMHDDGSFKGLLCLSDIWHFSTFVSFLVSKLSQPSTFTDKCRPCKEITHHPKSHIAGDVGDKDDEKSGGSEAPRRLHPSRDCCPSVHPRIDPTLWRSLRATGGRNGGLNIAARIGARTPPSTIQAQDKEYQFYELPPPL